MPRAEHNKGGRAGERVSLLQGIDKVLHGRLLDSLDVHDRLHTALDVHGGLLAALNVRSGLLAALSVLHGLLAVLNVHGRLITASASMAAPGRP